MHKYQHIWKILFFDMFVIEFGPVGVFFVAYYLSGFGVAALALAISTGLALVLSRTVNKRVPWFAIFSGTITMVTATTTYLYDSPAILILKDTAFYFLFALLLAIGIYRKRSLFEKFFGHIFAITHTGWELLERRWLAFFLCAGIANELVRMYLSTSEWVLYKQGVVLVFLAFGLYQFRISKAHRLPDADALGLRTSTPVQVRDSELEH